MKKILSIAVASLAVAAVAADFSPNIGVTTLVLTNRNTVIPVQYTSLDGGGTITADALVCTNNIPLQSHLVIYNNGSYTAWTLLNTGWEALDVATTVSEISVGIPQNQELATGSAIWLCINNADVSYDALSPSIKVSLYGVKPATATTTTVEANKATLVCNMTGSYKLFSELLKNINPVKGDKIMLIPSGSMNDYYSYNADLKVWGYRLNREQGLPELGPYQAFWYTSAGGSGTISWE